MPRAEKTKTKPARRPPKMALTGSTTCPLFAEAPAWQAIGPGWHPLFGDHHALGFSFEWHDVTVKTAFDWARTFHPGSLELCLNLDGKGSLTDARQTVEILPQTFAFYFQGQPPLTATRHAGETHRFITIACAIAR